jgi:hypothetical protein
MGHLRGQGQWPRLPECWQPKNHQQLAKHAKDFGACPLPNAPDPIDAKTTKKQIVRICHI